MLYQIRDPANHRHLIDEVCITADFATALALLGYDAPRYAAMRATRQFRTLDHLFRYVVSTPYANPAIYLLDQRSHKARIRDAKRATYNAFLTWLAQQPPSRVPAYPWGEEGTALRQAQQARFLHTALAQLPAFRERYDKALAAAARARQLKGTFNGALVAAITGLSGQQLGTCMQRVRATFADTAAFEQFLLEANNDSREALFLAAMDKT